MSSLVSKKQPKINSEINSKNKEEDELIQEEEIVNPSQPVSSHLYLKPAHTTGTLDKTVVLRRIRHRKRVNKVKSAVQGLLSSPFGGANDKKSSSSVTHMRWADDAFAAP